MRRLSQILTLCLIVTLPIIIGCEGPSGTEGPQGPEGPEGPVGPAGEDGSMMYSGQGEPGSDIGSAGDYYLDTDTGEMYGPKDDSGWGNPIIVLMGEDGADGQDGEDGSQIHSGSGAPDASLGTTGDYYLDKSSYELYGPKNSSGWGSPLNLKGADGNANVTRYIFPGHDFSATADTTLSIDSINSATEKRQSTWLVYLVNQPASYWAIPGNGKDGNTLYNLNHHFRPEFTDPFTGITVPSHAAFDISTENSVSGEQYDEIEVVRIEASNTVNNTKLAGETAIFPEDLDVSDYEALANYYGFYH